MGKRIKLFIIVSLMILITTLLVFSIAMGMPVYLVIWLLTGKEHFTNHMDYAKAFGQKYII